VAGAKDNTAAAVAEEEKTQEDAGDTVLFVDMGHSYLNVLVASYGRSKLTVLASLCDESAGAREFDFSLARHFAEEIQVHYPVSPSRATSSVHHLMLLSNHCHTHTTEKV
jgi:heat shock protein